MPKVGIEPTLPEGNRILRKPVGGALQEECGVLLRVLRDEVR